MPTTPAPILKAEETLLSQKGAHACLRYVSKPERSDSEPAVEGTAQESHKTVDLECPDLVIGAGAFVKQPSDDLDLKIRAVVRPNDLPSPDASNNAAPSNDLQQIPETRLVPNAGRQRQIPPPGAYRSDEGWPNGPWVLTHTASTDMTVEEGGREGLAVANMVTDTCLPHAEEMTVEASDKRAKARKLFKTKVLLGVILMILMMVMVLLVVLVPSKNKTTEAPSTSPSEAPTSIQDSILNLLPEETIDKILEEPTSPQAMAFEWLLEEHSSLMYLSNERIQQRFALATLFFSTDGNNWINNTHWVDHAISECDWYNKPDMARKDTISNMFPGFMREFFLSPPRTCDDNEIYQHLWLDQNHLVGSLPDEIYLMTSLKTLSVGWNQPQGTMSTKVGQLTKLEGVVVAHTHGEIPSQIGILTNLRLLIFGGDFEGSIPNEVWGLTNLDTLGIGDNTRLRGSIPTEIGLMTKLRWLVVENCDLSGTIPTEIGLATSLEWPALSQNRISGTIPIEMMQLSRIQILSLFANLLEGPIPSQMGTLSNLYSAVSLDNNRLSGSIPSELGLLTNLVVTLDMQRNHLTGSLPTELGQLSMLMELEFANNDLTGFIPSEFGILQSLGRLTFANNSLFGRLPLQQSLYALSLEGNPQLSGSIPDGLCHMNGTFVPLPANPRPSALGLSFDCSSTLCGCGCPCL